MTRSSMSKMLGWEQCDKGVDNWPNWKIYSQKRVEQEKTGKEGARRNLGGWGPLDPPLFSDMIRWCDFH